MKLAYTFLCGAGNASLIRNKRICKEWILVNEIGSLYDRIKELMEYNI